MPSIMLQGCGSDVGKTVLVAGLCRLLANRGLSVRPFKPQNMSNNAAVTPTGGEIGRSTALQALACRVAPSVDMNPILLKAQSDIGAQLIVLGQRAGTVQASAHGESKRELLEVALASYRALAREADWVVVEGAGSPAETNLRRHDIANMGFATAADVPVILIGDIDRGHVIASLIGAHAVLDEVDRAQVRGFLINKFRGDLSLFDAGLATIVERTGWPSVGVVPWMPSTLLLPEEDALRISTTTAGIVAAGRRRARIAVVRLRHIANFDDFDPLRHEPDVELQFVSPLDPLPPDIDLLIIPGSKATIADVELLRETGWEHDLHAHVRRGGRVLGICAGYQMLGRLVRDPLQIEGTRESIEGFGLLDVVTDMSPDKLLRNVRGADTRWNAAFAGYEMHIGRTVGRDASRPLLRFDDGTNDGAVHENGRIMGCHVHGLFDAPQFRSALLRELEVNSTGVDSQQRIDAALDRIAATLAERLDLDRIMSIAAQASWRWTRG